MTGLFKANALVSQQYEYALAQIRDALTKLSDNEILANSDEELTDHFYEAWKLEPVEEDPEREGTATQDREMRHLDHSEHSFGPTQIEVVYAVIDVPLIPKHSNAVALQLHGQSFLMSGVGDMAMFRERDHTVVLRLHLNQAEQFLSNLRTMFSQINVDIERQTPVFRPRVLQAVQQRRMAVIAHNSKFDETMSKLGVQVRKKAGAVEPVDVKVKREIRLLREKPARPADPALDPESVRQIVGLIDQSGKGFETTPSAYASLGEEQLRDIILGHLNVVFGPAAATGESFSKSGKTDIFLRVRKGVVLIAECKFWDGAKQYGETIDQLFGYLTWRQTTGILVTFSRRKGLTNVIESAKKATADHQSFSRDLKTLTPSYFSSVHVHPTDEQKLLEVHHLFLDMPVD